MFGSLVRGLLVWYNFAQVPTLDRQLAFKGGMHAGSEKGDGYRGDKIKKGG